MKVELPIYEVRPYFKKLVEGEFVVLQTNYNKYVLDMPSLEGDYWARRLALSCMDLPYKLYPLYKRISTLNQLAKSKSKLFIDSQGKLFRHTKTKFHNIEVHKVIACHQIYNGKWQNYCRGVPHPFITDTPASYLSLIKMGNSHLLFDIHETEPPERRYRVKL